MSKLKQDEKHHGHQWGLRVGTEIVASTMIGLGIGFFIDRWLDTRPLFLIIFAIFGIGAGFINLYQLMVIDMQNKRDSDKP
jgi:ATP synthase protein I